MAGLIVAFSGTDGSGKSTQAQTLQRRLSNDVYQPVRVWARAGHTPQLAWLKRLAIFLRLHRPLRSHAGGLEESRAARQRMPKWKRSTYLTLSILDLLRIYVIRLRWARWRREVVICDRYFWDSHVDMSVNFPETGFSDWLLWRALERLAPTPDVAFLLLVPSELAERGLRGRDEVDWRGQDHAGRLARYREMSQQGHWVVLDAALSKDDLADHIMRTVAGKLP